MALGTPANFLLQNKAGEAGLVFRSYCINTTTVYSPNWVNFLPMCHQKWTTTTYPKPKSLPQTPTPKNTSSCQPTGDRAISFPTGFFLDSLSCEAPAHQRPRCCCTSGPALSPLCSPWRPQRWPAAPKASGPGVRQGQVPRRPRPWGVMGCTLLLWVGEPKVTTELVDVDYRWDLLAWLRQDSFKFW